MKVFLIAQSFDSNKSLSNSLADLPAVYARIARDCPNVIGILAFSGSGRKSGLNDHPEVKPLWDQLAAGIPSAPPIVLIEPPAPTLPPTDPPAPPPVDPLPRDEDVMPLLSGEKFEEWIKEAGRIAEPFLKHDPRDPLPRRVQAEQGAREIGDKYRDPALQPDGLQPTNPSLGDLVMGAIFRSGMAPQNDTAMIPLVAEIRRTTERLRR